MTYVGATPTTGDFKKLDSITTSSATTFTLRQNSVAVYPQSANHCIVSLNGVIQAPVDAFTIVNDTIVFASSLASSDVINFILVLGNVNDIGVVSDDTVSQAKIQNEAINEAKMQISNAGSNGQFLSKQSGNTGGLTWAAAGGAADDYFASSGLSSKDLGSGLHIKTGDSGLGAVGANYDELIIEGSGRVGLNFLSAAGNKQDIAFSDADADAIGGIVYDHSNNTMGIATNNAERIRIGSDGDTGIGTASPTARLTVEKDSTTSWICHLENTASSNYGRVLQLNLDNDFDDNASVFMIAYGSSTERCKIFSDGDLQNHDNSYGSISDERIKQNITDANSQWDDIKGLRVRNFKRKDDVRQYGDAAWEQIGLVAQEVELVSPKLVKESLPSSGDILSDSAFGTLYTEQDKTDGIIPEDKNVGDIKTTTDEKVKGMKYSVLYMKAIKALQESMERIETLETKVTALENK